MNIKEIIVVEGKSDTQAIHKAVKADTIETNGSAIGQPILEAIKHAAEKRGVIIFTDPDFPGEKIRKTISAYVPKCKHAFLNRNQAKGKANESLGIEHASPEAIREALSQVYTEADEAPEQIPSELLMKYGLIGGSKARERREKLGEKLKIGYTNGKQLYKRLRMFQVAQSAFIQAIEAVITEENHEK